MPRNDKTGPGMLLCVDDDGAVSWLFCKGRIRLRLLKLALRTNQMIMQAESYPCYPGYMYPCGNPKPLLIPLLRTFQNVIQTPYKSISSFISRSPLQNYSLKYTTFANEAVQHKGQYDLRPAEQCESHVIHTTRRRNGKLCTGQHGHGLFQGLERSLRKHSVFTAFFLCQIHALKASSRFRGQFQAPTGGMSTLCSILPL